MHGCADGLGTLSSIIPSRCSRWLSTIAAQALHRLGYSAQFLCCSNYVDGCGLPQRGATSEQVQVIALAIEELVYVRPRDSPSHKPLLLYQGSKALPASTSTSGLVQAGGEAHC